MPGGRLVFMKDRRCVYIVALTGNIAGSASNPQPHHERIEMIIFGVLIKHPTAGLLLFETGCHDEMEKHWGKVDRESVLCVNRENQ